MVRPMRKTRAPTQSQRAIGHIAALQSIATMFVMHAMVGRSTLQFKMPRLDAYGLADKRSFHGLRFFELSGLRSRSVAASPSI